MLRDRQPPDPAEAMGEGAHLAHSDTLEFARRFLGVGPLIDAVRERRLRRQLDRRGEAAAKQQEELLRQSANNLMGSLHRNLQGTPYHAVQSGRSEIRTYRPDTAQPLTSMVLTYAIGDTDVPTGASVQVGSSKSVETLEVDGSTPLIAYRRQETGKPPIESRNDPYAQEAATMFVGRALRPFIASRVDEV